MCGISVVVHQKEAVAAAAVRRMNGAQAHRGPDGVGVCVLGTGSNVVALGHRRLAIQDVSAAGAQPMENPATGDVIVYNGELYNVAELRAELLGYGATFRSRSDTEVLLAAFARWGIDCVDRFSGMFAFALWAPRERKLYVARDPVGIKPLYWTTTDDGALLVASELRAILATGMVDVSVDRQALASLLAYGAVAQPRTIVAGVRLLEPGCWGVVDLAGASAALRVERYWDIPNAVSATRGAQAAEILRAPLRESVRSHLVSDVPVAVFLSGGIDSTVVAALASEARRGEIDTFTVSLAEDAAIDEAPVARATAKGLGTAHHEVTLGEKDALSLATKWLASIDQPTVDGLNTFVISRAARERGIVVALSGLGGDEMFGGYSSFRDVPLLTLAARGARRARQALERTGWQWPASVETRIEKFGDIMSVEPTVIDVALSRRRLLSNRQMTALGFGAEDAPHYLPSESEPRRSAPISAPWAGVRAIEARFYLSNMLLRDADVFGMANGMEIRVPFLDRRVLDTALGLTPLAWLSRRQKRDWLMRAMRGAIPPQVVNARKRGFSLPYSRWMRGPLREALSSRLDHVAGSGLVDPAGVRAVWARFTSEPEGPAWSRAWLLGTLGAWLEQARGWATCVSAEHLRAVS